MAVGVKCPYCGRVGYTSSPQANHICPYCGQEHDFFQEKVRAKGKSIILTPRKKRERGEKHSL